MILGPVLATWILMGSVLLQSIPDVARQTSRWGSTIDSGPSVGNISLHGFCFAAIGSRSGTPNIDSRSGTPNIPLGPNGMILGTLLATWVLVGSVLLPSIPDCQSKPPQALRRFGLVMMTSWMNKIRPFCNLKMVSIGSHAPLWLSEQASSSLEEVWLGHADSTDG